jgi:hypothetical protein
MTSQNRQGWSLGPQVIFGLGVVVFGLLLTANNLGLGRFSVAIHFWPLVFTALGFAILLDKGCTGQRKVFGGVLVVAGLWQTAVEAFGFHVYINDYWPLILVGLGVLLVVRSLGPKAPVEDYTNMGTSSGGSMPYGTTSSSSSSAGPLGTSGPSASAASGSTSNFAGGDEVVNAFAFMGGVRRNIVSPAFRRGNLTAIMGGVVLDMRQSQATGGETIVEVFAIWGGIEVKVPPDWQVVNEIAPIMGGVEDRSLHTQPIRHRLVLKGVVIMAGVEVKS